MTGSGLSVVTRFSLSWPVVPAVVPLGRDSCSTRQCIGVSNGTDRGASHPVQMLHSSPGKARCAWSPADGMRSRLVLPGGCGVERRGHQPHGAPELSLHQKSPQPKFIGTGPLASEVVGGGAGRAHGQSARTSAATSRCRSKARQVVARMPSRGADHRAIGGIVGQPTHGAMKDVCAGEDRLATAAFGK